MKTEKPPIVLASASPRRRDLLLRVGLTGFQILIPQADESFDPALAPGEVVSSISRKKALAARPLAGEAPIIIAADTMVFLDDQRLGKPQDQADACRMLRALSGRTHTVWTGLTLAQGDRLETEAEATEVLFRSLEEAEILRYVQTGEPMDKAGAYGLQDRGSLLVAGVRGDCFNVMGLPLARLGQMLRRFGVELL